MSREKEINKNVSRELLESYRQVLYKVKEFFDSVNKMEFDPDNIEETMKIVDSILKSGEKLGKNIETLAILEAKVEKDELAKTSRRGNVKTSLFED